METPKSDPEQLELFPEAKPIEETVEPYRFCSYCGAPIDGHADPSCLSPVRHSRPF